MIIQTNTWVCEVCGAFSVESHRVRMHADEIIVTPADWDYRTVDGAEKLCCAECVEKCEPF